MTKILTVLVFFAVGLTSLHSASGAFFGRVQDHSDQAKTSTSDEGTTWRHTRFGWEDSRYWEPVTELRPEPMPGMHPLAWAGLLTLSVLVLLIWASETDEVARLAPALVSSRERSEKPELTATTKNAE